MRVKVDMIMLTKLLRQMYGQHPVVISVREMLQNAKDACLRAGVIPKISIEIQTNSDGTWVICKDNGCGMTKDIIDNAFMSIGNPHKELEDGAVGRFGIGIKVAINSQSEWYVRTNEFAFDNTFLLDEDKEPVARSTARGAARRDERAGRSRGALSHASADVQFADKSFKRDGHGCWPIANS